MKSHNFCPECGNSLSQGAKTCPKCGILLEDKPVKYVPYPIKEEILGRSSTIESKKKNRSTVKKWGHFSWILLLMGGVIGLYALFTPAGSIHLEGLYYWDMWMFGYNKTYDWETGWDNFWTLNEDLLGISLGSTIFVVIGNILALISAGYLIKRGIHKSYLAIAAPITIVGAALFYLAAYEVMFYIYMSESFWSVLNPAFGIFGQFLAALFMVLGFLIARSAAKYQIIKDKHKHQENLYLMLRKFIESGQLQEEEKESLRKQLEIIELRFIGIDLLQDKIELLLSRKHRIPFLDPSEFEKALEYFRKALELSSNQNLILSQKDLQIASKIVIEQDKKRALFYLNQIRSQTDLFLADILIKYRSRKFPIKSEWKQKITPDMNTPTQVSSRFPPISELIQQASTSNIKTETDVKDEEDSLVEDQEKNSQKDKKPEE